MFVLFQGAATLALALHGQIKRLQEAVAAGLAPSARQLLEGLSDLGGVGRVARQQGRRRGAERLRQLLESEDYIRALGAMSGNQAVQQVKAGAEPHGLTVWPRPGRYSLGHTGILR